MDHKIDTVVYRLFIIRHLPYTKSIMHCFDSHR